MENRVMKWHIFNRKSQKVLTFEGKAIEFDTEENAKSFLKKTQN